MGFGGGVLDTRSISTVDILRVSNTAKVNAFVRGKTKVRRFPDLVDHDATDWLPVGAPSLWSLDRAATVAPVLVELCLAAVLIKPRPAQPCRQLCPPLAPGKRLPGQVLFVDDSIAPPPADLLPTQPPPPRLLPPGVRLLEANASSAFAVFFLRVAYGGSGPVFLQYAS